MLRMLRRHSGIVIANQRQKTSGQDAREPPTGCRRSREGRRHKAERLMQMELAIKTKTFRDAEREQTSILAPLERAALRGLARRMPARVNSDHLSILGF